MKDDEAVKENFRKSFDEIFKPKPRKKPHDLKLRASQKPAADTKSPNNGENDNDRR